jgi:hypothetical protein
MTPNDATGMKPQDSGSFIMLIQFEYITNKLVTESEEILAYFSMFYFIIFVVIRQVNTILEVATRWKTTVNTEHLLRMASC